MTPGQKEEWLTRSMAEHGTPLLRMAYVYLGDRALAEDAVQETFLKAYRALDRFRGESSERTWLTRIAMNTCVSMRRTAWMRTVWSSPALEALPEPAGEDERRDDTVLQAVMALPDKLKQVVLLRYYRDMKVSEVAEALRISPNAVSVRLGRARSQLRAALKGWYFDAEPNP